MLTPGTMQLENGYARNSSKLYLFNICNNADLTQIIDSHYVFSVFSPELRPINSSFAKERFQKWSIPSHAALVCWRFLVLFFMVCVGVGLLKAVFLAQLILSVNTHFIWGHMKSIEIIKLYLFKQSP